ncbi:hypothetical protein GGR52DRAFT_568554 [Hypoxylon sp. FL1284]|nr:hypothetical protein GGR52DRAFT_568554 [Hypoxylon sp. FL1284]
MAPKRRYTRPLLPPVGERLILLLKVDIYHSNYPGMKSLISFNCSDDGGVDYNIAYYATTLLAGNMWKESEGRNHTVKHEDRDDGDCYFSRTLKPEPIEVPRNDILPAGVYYFFVPGHDDYAIFPNFDQWKFPSEMPVPWSQLKAQRSNPLFDVEPGTDGGLYAASSAAEIVDRPGEPPLEVANDFPNEACRITGFPSGLSLAHVIPRVASGWFDRNHMRRFATSLSASNDPQNDVENLIPLRTDLHYYFDYSHFTILPKRDRDDRDMPLQSYSLVVHVLNPPGKSHGGDLTILKEYHNLECYPMRRIPVEYLFARFAWSIMHEKMALLLTGDKAKKTDFQLLITEFEAGVGYQTHTETVRGGVFKPRAGLQSTDGQGKSRKKRRLHGSPDEHHADAGLSDSEYDSSTSSNSDSDMDRFDDFGPAAYERFFEKALAEKMPIMEPGMSTSETMSDDEPEPPSDSEEEHAKQRSDVRSLPSHVKVDDRTGSTPIPVDLNSSFGTTVSSEDSTQAGSECDFGFRGRVGNAPTRNKAGERKGLDKEGWSA